MAVCRSSRRAASLADAEVGLIKVLDRGHGADQRRNMGEAVLEAIGAAPAHGRGNGRGERPCEPIVHESGQALLGKEPGVQQGAHPRGDVWSARDRCGHAIRKDGSCHGPAVAAEAAMRAMFRDIRGRGSGTSNDLSPDGCTVTVGVRQRCAAARTGGRVIIQDMVRRIGPRQSRSLVARLAAAWPQ